MLGMKWGVRRTPEQLGHPTKMSKEDRARRKNVVRETSSAYINLRNKYPGIKAARDQESAAQAAYQEALRMIVMPWNKEKKYKAISEAEAAVKKAYKDAELPELDWQRAKKYAADQEKKMLALQEEFNKTYGKENINQLKTVKRVKTYADEGFTFSEKFFKTGMNVTKIPIVGTWIASEYIANRDLTDYRARQGEHLEELKKSNY